MIVFVLFLHLLFSGARPWLQEHLLWRNGAERHKPSSGADGNIKKLPEKDTGHLKDVTGMKVEYLQSRSSTVSEK